MSYLILDGRKELASASMPLFLAALLFQPLFFFFSPLLVADPAPSPPPVI